MLRRLGHELARPHAIVVVSAHWEAHGPVRVTSSERPPLIYDFSGFPEALYDVRYPAPGDPALAGQIVREFAGAGIRSVLDPRRGLDHGVWVPLIHAIPAADVPVTEVSLPLDRTPAGVGAMGRALSSLREQGVLLVGSGGIVHNLRRVRLGEKAAPVDPWARGFDQWVRDRLGASDRTSLEAYRSLAPEAALAVPTSEHFDPLFFVLGAAAPGEALRDLYSGFYYGNLSMRCFQLGA